MPPIPPPKPVEFSPRQGAGLVIYMLGVAMPGVVLAHDLLGFGWCLLMTAAAGAIAGAIALSPRWTGFLSGAVAGTVSIALTLGWVALDGPMRMGDIQPRRFLFLAVPVIVGLVPGFGLYVLLRLWLGLPIEKPGSQGNLPGPRQTREKPEGDANTN